MHVFSLLYCYIYFLLSGDVFLGILVEGEDVVPPHEDVDDSDCGCHGNHRSEHRTGRQVIVEHTWLEINDTHCC